MPLYNPVLTKINKKEMLRYAGMKEENAQLDASVSEALRETLIYSQPKGSYILYDYIEPEIILADGVYALHGKRVIEHLAGSVKVAVIAVTVGEDVEQRIEMLFDSGEYTKAILMDAAATAAVEQSADSLCAFIADRASKEGLFISKRFSPGYGDWELENQKDVLELSGGKDIGMDITSAFMLRPRKSITAVIGLKPFEEKGVLANCGDCEKDECGYRRIINVKNV